MGRARERRSSVCFMQTKAALTPGVGKHLTSTVTLVARPPFPGDFHLKAPQGKPTMPVRSPITRTFAGKAVSMSAPNPETNRQIGTAPRRRPDMQRLVAMALGLFVASMVLLASPLLAREAQGMAFRNTREQGAVGKYDARTFGVYQNVDDS